MKRSMKNNKPKPWGKPQVISQANDFNRTRLTVTYDSFGRLILIEETPTGAAIGMWPMMEALKALRRMEEDERSHKNTGKSLDERLRLLEERNIKETNYPGQLISQTDSDMRELANQGPQIKKQYLRWVSRFFNKGDSLDE